MSIIDEAVRRKGQIYYWNESEWEVWAAGSDPVNNEPHAHTGYIGDLNVPDDFKEFIEAAPAFILLQQKAIGGLLQDKKDLQTLVKLVELGSDDLTESLRELADAVLKESGLCPQLREIAQLAKELVDV